MKKILLALSSQTIGEALTEKLSGAFEAVLCTDANETVQQMSAVRPDVLVLDLMLAGMDSLSILRGAKDAGLCNKTVVLTGCVTKYILTALEDLNVCYLVRMPSDAGYLAGRIADIAFWEPGEDKITHSIRNILLALGCKINTEAYRITERAVWLLAQNPTMGMTTGLYPAVADSFGCTTTKVERAIRLFVDAAWTNGNEKIWRLYFAAGRNGTVRRPSNGEFLMRIVQCIESEMGETIKAERRTS